MIDGRKVHKSIYSVKDTGDAPSVNVMNEKLRGIPRFGRLPGSE